MAEGGGGDDTTPQAFSEQAGNASGIDCNMLTVFSGTHRFRGVEESQLAVSEALSGS